MVADVLRGSPKPARIAVDAAKFRLFAALASREGAEHGDWRGGTLDTPTRSRPHVQPPITSRIETDC
jgi:hypothetical protein